MERHFLNNLPSWQISCQNNFRSYTSPTAHIQASVSPEYKVPSRSNFAHTDKMTIRIETPILREHCKKITELLTCVNILEFLYFRCFNSFGWFQIEIPHLYILKCRSENAFQPLCLYILVQIVANQGNAKKKSHWRQKLGWFSGVKQKVILQATHMSQHTSTSWLHLFTLESQKHGFRLMNVSTV